jgi:hypothetical protein
MEGESEMDKPASLPPPPIADPRPDGSDAAFRLGVKLLSKRLRRCAADLDTSEAEPNVEFAESIYSQVMHELLRIVRQTRPLGPQGDGK